MKLEELVLYPVGYTKAQTKKLLYMPPEVQTANMKDVKALKIKTFIEELEDDEINEASLQGTIDTYIAKFLGDECNQITDTALIDRVLEKVKQIAQKSVDTVNGQVRIIHYNYDNQDWVTVDKPNSKVTLFKAPQDE